MWLLTGQLYCHLCAALLALLASGLLQQEYASSAVMHAVELRHLPDIRCILVQTLQPWCLCAGTTVVMDMVAEAHIRSLLST